MTDKREVWMRGPVADVPALLQPVAHSLLQTAEEVRACTIGFPDDQLWIKPNGMASVGFHLQHLRGILDRLFTYANGGSLTEQQLAYLASEGIENNESTTDLVKKIEEQVTLALQQLKQTREDQLLQSRGIGRKKIPTTLIGLLFHAAEHAQRHAGQLLVTIRLLPLIQSRGNAE